MPPSVECVDTDNGDANSWLEECTYYTSRPDHCGFFDVVDVVDVDDFVSSQMCCACKFTGMISGILYNISICFIVTVYDNNLW